MKFLACVLLLTPVLLYAQAPPPPPPRAQPAQPPVRIGGDVALASLLVRVDPEYPALARAAHLEDNVMLQVQISKEGKLTALSVFRGHPLLHDAAIQAVRQWQFKPILFLRQPVEVITVVTVNFSSSELPDAPRLVEGNALISGQIRHADGRPASNAFVLASVAGAEAPAVSPLIQTDSTGVYRITNLPAGTYHVQAGTAIGPSAYYPGVANLTDATTISVASDQTIVGQIDFTIP